MSSGLAGLGALLRLGVRRDRVRLPVWLAAIGGLCLYFGAALPIAYPDPADLSAIAGFMQSPAGVVLSGPGYGWDEPTYASAYAGVYALYLYLAAALMGVALVARHTRAEEESGRLELVRSAAVGADAPLTAAVAMLLAAGGVLGVLGAAGAAGAGYAGAGAVLFGAALTTVTVVFGAAALLAAQLVEHARSVVGLGALAVGVALVVRGVGDVAEPGGSWLSWLSPLAWAQQTRVFVDDRWWPLAPGGVLAASLVVAAYALQRRRDVGGALWPARPGRSRAVGWLSGPVALLLRLERGSLLGWSAALLVLSALYGGLTGSVSSSLAGSDNALLVSALGGDPARLVDGYLATTVLINAYVVLCYAVATARRLVAEERSGRLEVVLAAAVARPRWQAGAWLTALLGTLVLLLVAGLGLGVAAAATLGEPSRVLGVLGATLAYAPAIAVVLGVAVLGYGVGPAWLDLGWAAAIGSILVGYVRLVVDLPDALADLFPLTHVAQAPLEAPAAAPLVVLSAVALGLLVVALALFGRRDLR